MLEQWFRMGEARNLEEFKDALRMMSVPMWHANYADDQGHIMFVFDGLVPKRNGHDYQYWNKVVPGDTSETMWTDYLSFDELPKSIDPPAGLQPECERAAVDDDAFRSSIGPSTRHTWRRLATRCRRCACSVRCT